MKTMNVNAKHSFRRGFIITPEHLQTIQSIISERFPEVVIEYKITLVNFNSYSTHSLEEVLHENNGITDNIVDIIILASQDDQVSIVIDFEKKSDIYLAASGTNRDSIFLVFNTLKTYIDKEIATVRRFEASKEIFPIIFMLPILIGYFITSIPYYFLNTVDTSEILKNTNTNEKIDFLISNVLNSSNFEYNKYSISMMLGLYIIFTLCFVVYKMVKPISDCFLLGKECSLYEKKVKTRQNIIWCIIIAFIISSLSGFFVYFFTNT